MNLLSEPLADACPACFPGDAPRADPAETWLDAEGCISASYLCPLCGFAWITRWKVAFAWPAARVTAPADPALDRAIGLLSVLLDGEELEAA